MTDAPQVQKRMPPSTTGFNSGELHDDAFERKVIMVEDDLRLFFRPHGGQKKVLYSVLFQMLAFVFVQCGRKFGKSELAIYCCYWFAMMFDGCEVYYVADTQKHAREIVWTNGRIQNFLKKCRRRRNETPEDFVARKKVAMATYDKWIDKVNNSDMKVYLKNGSFIGVEGAENFANADGLEPQFLVYDEFKHHDPRFNEAMEPNMDVYNGTILAIGTPPDNVDNYYSRVAADCRRREDAAFHCMPSFMNEHVYEGGEQGVKFQKIIRKYMDRGEWDVLQREYYAQIVQGGSSAVFPMFEPASYDDRGILIKHSRHVRPHSDFEYQFTHYVKDWDFFVSADPGTTTVFAVLFMAIHRKSKAVVLFDEIYEQNQRETSTRSIFPRVLQKMQKIPIAYSDWTLVYDYAAAWFANEVAVEYDFALMPCEKDLKNKEKKLGQIKDIINAGLFFMSEQARMAASEMSNYIKDKDGKLPKSGDHQLDNLRYALNAASYDFSIFGTGEEEIDLDSPRGYTIDRDIEIDVSSKDEWDILGSEFYD